LIDVPDALLQVVDRAARAQSLDDVQVVQVVKVEAAKVGMLLREFCGKLAELS
jgi:hypothetical protein